MRLLAPHVYHIPLMPRHAVNCYIIEGVLIDSGIKSSFHKINKCLAQVSVHAHALTHAHPDHQGSTNHICRQWNLPLYCHAGEVELAGTETLTKSYRLPLPVLSWVMDLFMAGKSTHPTLFLKENDTVESFKVVETPGHSSGHICFFRESDGVLIIGDAANNMHLLTTAVGLRLPYSMLNEDQDQVRFSIKKLASLRPKIIAFGHGPVLHNTHQQFEKFAARL